MGPTGAAIVVFATAGGCWFEPTSLVGVLVFPDGLVRWDSVVQLAPVVVSIHLELPIGLQNIVGR